MCKYNGWPENKVSTCTAVCTVYQQNNECEKEKFATQRIMHIL